MIEITGRVLFDLGLWEKYCDITGTNVWCINEGLADMDTKFEMTTEQATKIGLLDRDITIN